MGFASPSPRQTLYPVFFWKIGNGLWVLGQMGGPTFGPIVCFSKQLAAELPYWTRRLLSSPLAAFSLPLTTPAQASITQESLHSFPFLESPNPSFGSCPLFNTATSLPNVTTLTHSCLELLDTLTYRNPQLPVSPLSHSDCTWFIDGSSSLRSTVFYQAGYAMVSSDPVVVPSSLHQARLLRRQSSSSLATSTCTRQSHQYIQRF